ncbi:MAG: hypothetical protein IT303_06030 [Dehalococcoidia bacterium]|nr:hypothetical protein [Dehalococcoidia bacterium]
MIVRIMGEGQFEVGDDVVDRLNELDGALDADLQDDGDDDGFRHHLAQMVELVRSTGQPVEADRLVPSDCIIPPADVSIAELREMLGESGLVPG